MALVINTRALLLACVLLTASAVAAQQPSFTIYNKWCAQRDSLLLFPKGNNLITIICTGIAPADLEVKSLDNALRIGLPEIKGDTISMLAMPYPKYGARMRLAVNFRKTKKNLATCLFYAEKEPHPVAVLADQTADHIDRKDIAAKPWLKVAFPGSFYAYPYRIKEFTFKTRVGGKDVSLPWKGQSIGHDLQQIIKDLPPGTFVEFTDIKATCPQCIVRDLAPVKVWIK